VFLNWWRYRTSHSSEEQNASAVATQSGTSDATRRPISLSSSSEQVGVADFHEEPARPTRERRHNTAAGADQVDDTRVETLARHEAATVDAAHSVGRAPTRGQQSRDRVGGLDHRGVAQDNQVPRSLLDESHRG